MTHRHNLFRRHDDKGSCPECAEIIATAHDTAPIRMTAEESLALLRAWDREWTSKVPTRCAEVIHGVAINLDAALRRSAGEFGA